MEVRRNTRTSASFGRQTFVQGEQTNVNPLLQGAADLRAGLDAGRRQRQGFELQKRLLEESNKAAAELEARRRDRNFDPETFSTSVDSDYTDRANAVTEEFNLRGFDPDLVADFTLGMGRLRNSLTDTATGYQLQARAQKAVSDTSTLIDEGSRRVAMAPDDFDATADMIIDTIGLNPYLTEDERIKLQDAVRPRLRAVGQQSLLQDSPQLILDQLDPDGRWRQERAAPVTGTAASVVSGTAVGPRQDAIRAAAEELGVTPVELAGVASYESMGTFDPSIVGGAGDNYQGIFQFGPEERGKYVVDKNSTFEEQVSALVRFAKDRGYKPGMGWQKLYTTINAGNPNAKLSAADMNGTQRDHYRNIETTHFTKAREFLGINDDVAEGGERVPQAGDIVAIDPGQSAAGQNEFSQVAEGLPAAPRELHPVLRDATGEERLKLLALAYEETEQKQSNNKAEMDLRIDNIRAQIATNDGDVSLPYPTTEELTLAYGEIGAGQIMAELDTLKQRAVLTKDWTKKSEAQIIADLKALEPAQDDPALAVKAKLYAEAQEVAQGILDKRLEDPAAYAIQTNPEIAKAVEGGDSRKFYALQRAEQNRLGIPKSLQNPWPQAYIDEQKTAYPLLNIEGKYAWIMRHITGATEDEFGNFAQSFEGTPAFDDILTADLLYRTRSRPQVERLLPLILQGSTAIKDDPAKRPPAEKMLIQFRQELLSGVANVNANLSRTYQNMATSIYVARGGNPTEPDINLYREALREAVGGKYNDPNTGWTSYAKNGVKDLTILPPSVTAQQFDSWYTSLTVEALQKQTINGWPRYATGAMVRISDLIDYGVPVMVEPNVYTIKFKQGGGVTEGAYGTDGKPIRIRIDGTAVASATARPRREIAPLPITGPKY
jgi:hypothetical protein